MHAVIITGLSGAGKSRALNVFEDQDYYCIDNLPLEMLEDLFENDWVNRKDKVAICVDVRSGRKKLAELPELVRRLKSRFRTDLLYLYASRGVIFKRYDETRRKHPLSTPTQGLDAAINAEYDLLKSVRAIADMQLDTSNTDIYTLANIIKQRVCILSEKQLSLSFQSFGFKYGSPRDSDFIFDVRCLPNPYWEPELREHSGRTELVSGWLAQQPLVTQMQSQIIEFLEQWIPHFISSQRAYLTLSIGCTGGHHRSVYLIDQLADYFQKKSDVSVIVTHREMTQKTSD